MILRSDFEPAWWLRSPHLQTLWAGLLNRCPLPEVSRERVRLSDGDFVDVDWTPGPEGGPIVLLLHGLEGSIRSGYMRGMCRALGAAGYRCAAMHFRGCSGSQNLRPRTYHSGETGDLGEIVRLIRAREPDQFLGAVGFSLGGNVLLKWLGERGAEAGIDAAVAVSAPLVLEASAARLNEGFSRLYRWSLLRALRRKIRDKFRPGEAPIDLSRLAACADFRTFDELVTAPLHGFAGAADYYARSSSRQYLPRVRRPTLIVQAADDPFMHAEALPEAGELSPTTVLELSEAGGHVGFVAGTVPGVARYWLELRIPVFLDSLRGKGRDARAMALAG